MSDIFRKNIFLTGEKQVGKSTLLRKVISDNTLRCTGFETLPFTIGGERKGFYLHSLAPLEAGEQDAVISVRIAQRQSIAIPESFDRNGTHMLEAAMNDPAPFILMDELGKFERNSFIFCDAVRHALNSEKRVIGVLQRCDAPLVSEIAARSDTLVIEVTPENRDKLSGTLSALLAGQNGGSYGNP